MTLCDVQDFGSCRPTEKFQENFLLAEGVFTLFLLCCLLSSLACFWKWSLVYHSFWGFLYKSTLLYEYNLIICNEEWKMDEQASLKNHIWNFWIMIWMVWNNLFPRHVTVLQNIQSTVIKIKLCPKHEDYFFPKKKALDHIKPVIWSDRTLLIEFYILAKYILHCILLSTKNF